MVSLSQHVICILVWLTPLCLCGWTNWGPWQQCSQTCGMGIQTRFRQCVSTPTESCNYANETEEVVCSIKRYCDPVNGGFGEWGAWNNCSRRCGGGMQWRKRECDSPRAMYGGKFCEGDIEQTKECATHICPVLYNKSDGVICPENHVICGSGKQCIVSHHRCDGFYDCHYGTDESACIEGEPIVFVSLNSTGNRITSALTIPVCVSVAVVYYMERQLRSYLT